MGGLLRWAGKLKGRSIAELRVRAQQAAGAWIERHVESDRTREPNAAAFWRALDAGLRTSIPVGDDAELLTRFRRSQNSFFASFDDRDATILALRTHWPDAPERILRRADEIGEGRFSLLGYDQLSFGSPIDWHTDPISGRTAPRVHWSRVPYLDASVVGDHKVIWELNRHQYFLTLGRAYWLSGDERYARIIAEHLSSWMDANSRKVGINWASSLEVSFRAMSWVWALHFLKQSKSLTPPLYRRVLASLDRHARHVESYLSTYFSPNTHLTGEALGLFVLGVSLPQLSAAQRWRRVGQSILEEQLPRQVRSDGVYVEQSPYYQRYTADFYLHLKILAGRSRIDVNVSDKLLQAALDHLATLTRPDGSVPLIGDDDGGRLLAFDEALNDDCRSVFSTATAVYDRADYAWIARGPAEETLWLLGPAMVEALSAKKAAPPTRSSQDFPSGGFYVMRDRWSADASVAVIDAGPHGYLNAGHAHADALGLDLTVGGKPLFVDPGTFRYVPAAERNRFRATAAHNCVTVDGESSSALGDAPFVWKSMARAETTKWSPSAEFDVFVGRHDGFERLAEPARYERTVLFLKNRYWIVRDKIESDGDHSATIHFHCAPGVRATKMAPSSIQLEWESDQHAPVTVLASFGGDSRLDVIDDFVSPAYGKLVPAVTCVMKTPLAHMHDIVTFIGAGVRAVDVIPGATKTERTFRVIGDGFVDVFAFDGTTGDVETDAEWIWVRSNSETERPSAFLASGVSTLRIGDETIISASRRIDCVQGENAAGQWCSGDGTPLTDIGRTVGDRSRLPSVGERRGRALLPSKD